MADDTLLKAWTEAPPDLLAATARMVLAMAELRQQRDGLIAALRGLAQDGALDPARLVGFCDDGYLCQHPECERARDALAVAEGA